MAEVMTATIIPQFKVKQIHVCKHGMAPKVIEAPAGMTDANALDVAMELEGFPRECTWEYYGPKEASTMVVVELPMYPGGGTGWDEACAEVREEAARAGYGDRTRSPLRVSR